MCVPSVVESYTFNFSVSQMSRYRALLTFFQYFEVPGTGVKIPMMTLGEDLMKMSLSDRDAVTSKSPKPPTLGEVKKSLRVCEKARLRISANYHLLVPCQAVDSRGKSNG